MTYQTMPLISGGSLANRGNSVRPTGFDFSSMSSGGGVIVMVGRLVVRLVLISGTMFVSY